MPGRQEGWNGVTKTMVRVGAVAVAISALIGLGTQIDARYARAADVQAIQSDILQLRRDVVYRTWLDFRREEARRPLTPLEGEQKADLERQLRQIDERLRKSGRSP